MKFIKLTFLGDIMMPNEILNNYKNDKGFLFDEIFTDIRDYLYESDYVIANLETPISENRNDINKNGFSFTTPIEFLTSLKKAGIDFVSTANNHCLDNGEEGINKTIESLDKNKIMHTGIFKDKPFVTPIKIKDIKISFLAFTYGTNAFYNHYYLKNKYKVNLIQEQELHNVIVRNIYNSKSFFYRIIRKLSKKFRFFQMNIPVYERTENSFIKKQLINEQLKIAKSESDIVIALLHDGGQYRDIPLKRANNNIKYLLNHGADFVVCNHEHVIQGLYKDKNNQIKAAYSLGNFTSINGVLAEPYDKMADYSIAFNLYFNNDSKKIVSITYSILKIVKCGIGKIKIVSLYDLIQNTENNDLKDHLIFDFKTIIKRVGGINNNIQKEVRLL